MKIKKRIAAVGLSVFLMGGLFITNVSVVPLKVNPLALSLMSVDPPGH